MTFNSTKVPWSQWNTRGLVSFCGLCMFCQDSRWLFLLLIANVQSALLFTSCLFNATRQTSIHLSILCLCEAIKHHFPLCVPVSHYFTHSQWSIITYVKNVGTDVGLGHLGPAFLQPVIYFYKGASLTHKIDLKCEFGLLSVGARVNAKDNMWLTPLHRAVASRSEVNTHLYTHSHEC